MNEPSEGHTFKAYDGALSELRRRAHQMGTLVAQQVETAVRALLESDREAAELVLRREQQINAWQTEIEAESFRLLARQAPVASDLRTVLAISRAVTDLERAGDESKKIARFALASAARARRARRGSCTGRCATWRSSPRSPCASRWTRSTAATPASRTRWRGSTARSTRSSRRRCASS